jgi:hypothetical protein
MLAYRLRAWAYWAVAGDPRSIGDHANLCMLCTASFCCKYPYIKYMFNFINIYRIIPVSG